MAGNAIGQARQSDSWSWDEDPSRYIVSQELQDAIDVAVLLRKPLLVTGEPGTGKTQLAGYVKWWLNRRDGKSKISGPNVFEAKSTSTAKDLFYTYDTLGRFQAKQLGVGSQDPVEYITYNALGAAILNTQPRVTVADMLPPTFEYEGPAQSVVLIDEVDKAPRDFPNDILNEIASMYFKVPELKNRKVKVNDERLRPFLVVTSNSEKNLPAAFLRRCIYYNIPFPTDKLADIICARISEMRQYQDKFVAEAIEFFNLLRSPSSGLQKKPATAELLDWLRFMQLSNSDFNRSLRTQRALLKQCLSTLIKSESDLKNANQVVDSFTEPKKS